MAKQQINPNQQPNIKRSNNGTNTSVSGGRIETGWGYITATATTVLIGSVSYNTVFTTSPIVVLTMGGDNIASGTTYGSGTAARQNAYGEAHTVTTSGFAVRLISGAAWTAGDNVFYQWIAIGI